MYFFQFLVCDYVWFFHKSVFGITPGPWEVFKPENSLQYLLTIWAFSVVKINFERTIHNNSKLSLSNSIKNKHL